MRSRESIITEFKDPVHVSMRRNTETYAATAAYVFAELSRLVTQYNTDGENNEQLRRLIRENVDQHLRRYHKYCIKGKIGAHYIDIDLKDKDVFEHIVPIKNIRDLLLHNIVSPWEACNAPTCKLSYENDVLLKETGWNSTTPDKYYFWKRYEYCFPIEGKFRTWNGYPVDTTMTLSDHWNLIGGID